MKIEDALNFLKDDLDKAEKQWQGKEQMMSLLQREDVDLEDLLDKFDPTDDENKWSEEYAKKDKRYPYLRLYRKRVAFLKASRKEFHEEYDEDVTDVDMMRLLELPYTDPRYVIETGLMDMGDLQ